MFDDSVTQKPAERGCVLGTGGRDWERCYAGGGRGGGDEVCTPSHPLQNGVQRRSSSVQRLGGAWGERMKVIQGWIKCAKEIHMGISLLLKAQAYIRYLSTHTTF